ncbi:CRISPR-associated protein Cas2 [Mobiluncus mulieris]|uniref:Putative ssRNA endonuclease n=1 Tax=Mobiluncus mulieris TaxID=2052 RepID=A0A8G2M636_9ACTO|nr:CRISPR-associated endoribonuclease Cas2 [Mobiluncus mulieris ATCC 35243]MBB5846383.1 CRISPR-associated protein Cas2 [Mobiluncus mulieris]MCV0001447.1 type I-E CRISPR-associated endoribonuclease Cas2 [Mobiluncus mulieris]MCV0012165.1 type I-E CRISPR-associated endoribonuclease Cas2 [Mobiluncus mulieris]SPX76218.1 putative ssRNA endonuclease [Mobiluncus mulieris]
MFVILTATAVPEHLHGYLSRFLTEVNMGVYVGKITPRVADALWERCRKVGKEGSLTLVQSDVRFEQGFSVRAYSPRQHRVRCFDGLWLGEMARNFEF